MQKIASLFYIVLFYFPIKGSLGDPQFLSRFFSLTPMPFQGFLYQLHLFVLQRNGFFLLYFLSKIIVTMVHLYQ